MKTTFYQEHPSIHHQEIPISPICLVDIMDAAIDLSDSAKALDLENIRFQLMYVWPFFMENPDDRNDRWQ